MILVVVMKEDRRLEILGRIEKIRQKKSNVVSLKQRLKALEMEPLLQEYFGLVKDVAFLESLDNRDIVEIAITEGLECSHDVYLFETYMNVLNGVWSYAREASDDTKIALFSCLDCGHQVEVPINMLGRFQKDHLVVNEVPFYQEVDCNPYDVDLIAENLRRMYLDFLFDGNGSEAVDKFKGAYAEMFKLARVKGESKGEE